MTYYDDYEQTHVHEFHGSTMLAELNEDPHNHRIAGISSEAICEKGGHIHIIRGRTDFYEDHSHEFRVFTGPPIDVGNGRHVHFVQAMTREADGHRHRFILATLIEDPISEES